VFIGDFRAKRPFMGSGHVVGKPGVEPRVRGRRAQFTGCLSYDKGQIRKPLSSVKRLPILRCADIRGGFENCRMTWMSETSAVNFKPVEATLWPGARVRLEPGQS
jgi:hypothetical protein